MAVIDAGGATRLIIGIVGSEEAKFTAAGKRIALRTIREILMRKDVVGVVSGKCHLGGIDIWAAEIGHQYELDVIEYPAAVRTWSGPGGYQYRNLLIARDCDELHCITVNRLPDDYNGMKFSRCYHCGTDEHVKSGGCWTMKKAKEMGKKTKLHVVVQ